MADNVHEQGLLAPLLEQEKARMQAAFDQQFQGSFGRLRESIESSRNDLEKRVTVLEKDLQAANQHNETLNHELEAAKESIKNLTEQLPVANQRANASEKKLESARDQSTRHKEEHGHKRKASTEHPRHHVGVSKPCLASAAAALASSPVVGERLDPVPPQFNEMDLRWTGRVIDTFTNTEFRAVISRVSAVKPASTSEQPWTTFISKDVRTMSRVGIEDVTKRFRQSCSDPFADTIVLRLEPAYEADKAAFDKVFDFFESIALYSDLYHPGLGKVKDTFLIPAPARDGYPTAISILNPSGLPKRPTENMLLLVVLYQVNDSDTIKVRLAWDDLIKTVHSSDVKKLAGMRDTTLINHPLPILHPRGRLLSRPSYAFDRFERLPVAIHGDELGPHFHRLHHISYSLLNEARAVNVDGVKLPECVFILGVTTRAPLDAIVLVDMLARERHLWHFCMPWGFLEGGCSGSVSLTLLRSKFPGSLAEWESNITYGNYVAQYGKNVRLCLKIERNGPLN
ncbi:hypothetical protein VSDG_04274 [Cytospora chrysosperma]|uniref:Spen paralogue and orthologue SPOC C-terminal domain-containing protein n=1 Tax=Cytospora chrysosperma TaxID=252740 RepID=A0A423W5H5_CYTCH|nr:hypothetical protein VSDG_04274 [Valsa sordida]